MNSFRTADALVSSHICEVGTDGRPSPPVRRDAQNTMFCRGDESP
jgi:hypothetical protein